MAKDTLDELSTVQRRGAKSGRVSYDTSPTVIHETSRSRITCMPFYIKRTEGDELAIKITTHKKGEPPMEWTVVEEKSLSLKEPAAIALLQCLKKHLAVAKQGEDGDFIVIRVADGVADVAELDPSVVAKAVAGILSKKDIVEHLMTRELGSELVSAFRGAIRLNEMQAAVAELRNSLESGVSDEKIYQKWCEKHSWAFGSAYIVPDQVREISPGDHVDLLLPNLMAGLRDIIELKRPDMEVLLYDRAHRDFYFSADVSKAVAQCHRYMDVLHEVAANGLRDHPQIVAYHPRATIVIGRSERWSNDQLKALHGLNRRMNGITVITYDQLLAQGEQLITFLNSKSDTEDDTAESQPEEDYIF